MKRLAALTALAASGCMTAPAPPPTIAPASATGAFASVSNASIAPVPDDWWRLYEDPALDRLVTASLAANADLRVAYANLDGARAVLRLARAQRLPQTFVESAATVDNPATQPSTSNVSATDYDIAASASWEVDLFGRLRSNALAAGADADAQAAVVDGLRVAVVADTVLAYVELCGATRAALVAREVVGVQERAVAVLRDQLAAGEISPLEVSQGASLLATVRSTVAPFEAARTNALYRLATLQGRPPAEAAGLRIACNVLPGSARCRWATDRRCYCAVPTSARRSVGWQPQPRGLGSRAPIYIRASTWGARSACLPAGSPPPHRRSSVGRSRTRHPPALG